MKIFGHLDLCGPELIEGWLYCDLWDGEPIALQVYADGRLIGECTVGRFRADLQEAGFGDGRCGFSFAVPPDAGIEDFSTARLRFLDGPIYILPSEDTQIAQIGREFAGAEICSGNEVMAGDITIPSRDKRPTGWKLSAAG